MKNKIEKKLIKLQKKAYKKWNINIDVNIDYSLKSIRILGNFNPITKTISLNLLLLNEFKNLYIKEVFIHEFCHAVVSYLYPFKYNNNGKRIFPHGKEFKEVCLYFGIEGKATTKLFNNSKFKLKTTTKSKNKYKYTCNCNKEHFVSNYINNKIRNGAIYICKSCKSKLKKN